VPGQAPGATCRAGGPALPRRSATSAASRSSWGPPPSAASFWALNCRTHSPAAQASWVCWLVHLGPARHYSFWETPCLTIASLCPGNHRSAGKRKHGRTGQAGTYIKPMLVQAAWSAIKTQGRLPARYHRLVRRFGGPKNPAAVNKAILGIAHTLLKIAYQVLTIGKPYEDPGADSCTRRESPEERRACLLRQPEKFGPGCVITITPHYHPRTITPAEAALKTSTLRAPGRPGHRSVATTNSARTQAVPTGAHITLRAIPRRHDGPGSLPRAWWDPSFVSVRRRSCPLPVASPA